MAEPPATDSPRGQHALTGRGIAAAVLVVIVAAVCIRLGFWQLERHAQREALNESLTAAFLHPPIELAGAALEGVLADPDAYLYRRVRIHGAYRADADLVLRGRAYAGNPGVHLVTPLLLHGEAASVLVNRGWVQSSDASSVDPREYAEPGQRTVEGIVQPLGSGVDTREAMLHVDGFPVRTLQRLDYEELREQSPTRLLPVLIQQIPTGEAAGSGPRRLPIPEIDGGPHRGYAFQWFSFATIAVIGFVTMLFLSRRRVVEGP